MSQDQQELNKAYVVGYLKNKNIEITMDNGKQVARGSLTVLVNNKYGVGEVEVNVMQYAEKNDKTPNSLFKALVTIAQTYKSIDEFGEAEADYIKIEGSIGDATYYSADKDDFREKRNIRGTFINRVDPSKEPSCAKACVEGTITEIKPDTENVEVTIISLGYNGIALPVTGKIQKDLAQIFLSKYKVGCGTTLNIDIVNSVEVIEVQKEVGFGENLGQKITKTTTDFIIFGGTPADFAKNNQEAIKQGLALRQAKLEEKKEKTLKKMSGNSTFNSTAANGAMATGAMATGFQGGATGFGGFSMPAGAGFGAAQNNGFGA